MPSNEVHSKPKNVVVFYQLPPSYPHHNLKSTLGFSGLIVKKAALIGHEHSQAKECTVGGLNLLFVFMINKLGLFLCNILKGDCNGLVWYAQGSIYTPSLHRLYD